MKPLTIGDKAPNFTGTLQTGDTVSLQSYSGKKIILYFYPKDNTPGCTAEAKNLNENLELLEKQGFVVIGVSPDSEKSHCNFIEKLQLKFNLIADTDKTILNLYEAWGEKQKFGRTYEGVLRKTYIISEAGIIEAIITNVDTKNHAEQILKELAEK